jgi:hypothetical protein
MADHRNRPLGAYATLAGAFGAGFGSFVAWRRSEGGLPECVSTEDIVLLGVAAHKLSRLVAKDKIASFVRAPFAEPRTTGDIPGEVEDRAKGDGLQGAVGQLVTCPHCLSMWLGAGLTAGLVVAPRETRLVAATLASVTVSDFLQAAYRNVAATEEAAEPVPQPRPFAAAAAG